MKTKGYYVRFNPDDQRLLEEGGYKLENKGSSATERIRNITVGYLNALRRTEKVDRVLWAKVLLYKEKHPEIKGITFEQIVQEMMEKLEKNK